jgi:hypothetical protein
MIRTIQYTMRQQEIRQCAQSKQQQNLYELGATQIPRITHVTRKQAANVLKDTVRAIGEDVLNIKADEVGTHSLQSGAAMAMFLGGLPVYLIAHGSMVKQHLQTSGTI